MRAVDTNILVYAHRPAFAQCASAQRHLVSLAEGHELWGIPVFCLGEFLRVITHPRFDPPFTPEEACSALERILESPSLRVLMPGPRYASLLSQTVREAGATGNLIFDAQVAALCRENGVRSLLTEDRDFARFERFQTERLERGR